MGPIIIAENGRSPEAAAAEAELWRGEVPAIPIQM